MILSLILIIFSLLFNSDVLSDTSEFQGAKIRILNKDTTEKFFYILPLSQTLEINNTTIIVHRCVKLNTKERQDDIALISHKSLYKNTKTQKKIKQFLNIKNERFIKNFPKYKKYNKKGFIDPSTILSKKIYNLKN